MTSPMSFVFKNLGPVTEAELEIRDLTIISGRNNTGKTYLVYALYGFMERLNQLISRGYLDPFFDSHFQRFASLSIDDLADRLFFDEHMEWQINMSSLVEEQRCLVREISQAFSKYELRRVFNAPGSLLKSASIDARIELPLSDHLDITLDLFGNRWLGLSYDGKNASMYVTSSEPEEEEEEEEEEYYTIERSDITTLYSHLLLRGVFHSYFRPFILPSTRHSAPLFIGEFDYARSQWAHEKVQERTDKNDTTASSGQKSRRSLGSYALPIHDNLNFNRSISLRAEWRDNKPLSEFPEDIEQMMEGYFTSKDRRLHFTSSENNSLDFEIPLHLASSSAWEMSNLYFYLGYHLGSSRSHFLIIDEPESHLDTANQIQFARFLARLVNSGIKVLITTHSDYIVREINNLIMLTSPLEDGEDAKRKLGYQASDELRLNQVRAYVAQDGRLIRCDQDRFGIEMSVFDETIDDLNYRSEELADQILMKESED